MHAETEAAKSLSYRDWLQSKIDHESYWFHQIELTPDLTTPGWSNPAKEKLPYSGCLNAWMTCASLILVALKVFSFEAERRGAEEVVAIDSYPGSVRRFNICRGTLNSRATAFLTNVYDLHPRTFGTFDLVLFFGVLYHLRHPLLALEKIHGICSGTLLMQTHGYEDPSLGEASVAKFHPFGIESGPADKPRFDPTVFWVPNAACTRDMLLHVGFVDVEKIAPGPGAIFCASAPQRSKGTPPNPAKAPWS